MSNLMTCYRYWRQHGRKPVDALQRARDDVAGGKARYPYSGTGAMAGGAAFKAYGEPAMMWFEAPGDYMRRVGFADELSRGVGHTGWYTDDDGDLETMRGIVYQIPARNGKAQYLYGYADPNNEGAACLSLAVADDKEDAARWADGVARIAAEQERDYQRAWRAGVQYNDLGEQVAAARQACLALIREAKEACDTLTKLPAVYVTVRKQVEAYVTEIREAREKRERLADDYGRELGFSDV